MTTLDDFPPPRVRDANDAPVRVDRAFVLYWMTSARRTTHNVALDRAVAWARHLDKPLLVFEPLRCGYPWASDRLHAFVLRGMAENASRLARRPVTYYPYVERATGEGSGLLAALGKQACVVVGDDYPAFFLPRMLAAASRAVDVRMELVDGNGLLPIRAADKAFARAYDFRRFLQRSLRAHLGAQPSPKPLDRLKLPQLDGLPDAIAARWAPADKALLAATPDALASLPIDHDVAPVEARGGPATGDQALHDFVQNRLQCYDEDRNHPDRDGGSALSPYLHFGHVGAHQVFAAIAEAHDWSPDRLGEGANGKRTGWWGLPADPEAFLDQLVTWRELGFNACHHLDDYDSFDTLPDWARDTLVAHAGDERPHVYSLEQFASALTHDDLWNAAQCQLRTEGRIHNYLRMLWGKKILEWTKNPRDALSIMTELNNKYALDGRDPNSYSGILWVLGRYDRPWGPERPIFGKVRYMTSKNTKRKLNVSAYLERYAPGQQSLPL